MAESKPGMFRKSAQAAKAAKSGSYKIKSGDTLSQIAKSRGTTVKKLMEMNPSIKNANQNSGGSKHQASTQDRSIQDDGLKEQSLSGDELERDHQWYNAEVGFQDFGG